VKIETLNKRENKRVEQFTKAYQNSVKRAVKKKGIGKSALALIRKDVKIISKALVNSGLALGEQWLESHLPKK